MQYHRTCENFCRRQGLACVGAWEEFDERCAIKSTHTCDFDFWTGFETSDAICECEATSKAIICIFLA